MESLWRKQTKHIIPKAGSGQAGREYSAAENSIVEHTEGNYGAIKKSNRDIIVIGAGMAGLLIAWYLKEQGKDVLVLEANEIASGQTERTTAKISSQHDLKYSKLIKKVGIKKARLYAQANETAIREYERLIQRSGIECQFEKTSAYLYSVQNETMLQDEEKAAAMLGIDAFFTKETELPFSVAGAVGFRNQAQFSPLEFVRYIAADLEIWEHTQVTAIKGNQVMARTWVSQTAEGLTESGLWTENVVLKADKIVVATHYPIRNVPGFYFLRQHQERSYVLALAGCGTIEGMYLGIDEGGLSFRQAGDYLLLGGSSRRTGENTCGGAYDYLMQAARKYYPNGKEVARWAAQDCMPHDEIPFIGKYSIFTPHLYVATGFQKWGMTTSMVAAMLLRDELCGIENPYAELFSPQRINLRAGYGNFLKDVGESVKGLTMGLVCRPRCPHMGCRLVWNPEERSWDCPCHGSRFDEDGKLLDNPAKKEVKKI